MFIDVANNTDGTVAYYFRFTPELTHNTFGLFYSKVQGKNEFVSLEPTDLSLYSKDDTEHVGWYWQPYEAQKPVWMLPYYNHNSDIFMISYVVPMYYENEFIGIVGMDFDYNMLSDKVHQIKIYENGFGHLEFEGADVCNAEHAEDAELHEHPEEYLSVTKKLKNGMDLIISANYTDIRQIRYKLALKICGSYGYAYRLYTKADKRICPNGTPYIAYAAVTLLSKHWGKKYNVIIPDYLLFPDWNDDMRVSYEVYRDTILKIWTDIPEGGVTETFVHPSVESDELKGITGRWKDRVWEYQLMKDPYVHKYLKDHGVELISYRELIKMKGGTVKG
jgi:hypothetical protein